MKEDTQKLIGKVLADKLERYERDAIHIAVAPVVAREELFPGQHVGIVIEGTDFVGPCEHAIGIVDPYLTSVVKKGEKFWLFLYPNTITGLKHHWEHSSFMEHPKIIYGIKSAKTKQEEAKAWLQGFADKWNFNWQEMVTGAINGTWVTAKGIDLHSSKELAAGDEKKFWRYMSILTGESFDEEHKKKFAWSCSC